MARDAELRARVTLDDKASKGLDEIADKAADVEKPVEVEVDANVRAALSALDDVAQEAKQTGEAAEALGRALGPELASKANLTGIVGDLRQMGLSIDDIKTNADQLGGKMRELADADIGGKLGQNLGTARGETEKLSDSARGANSALANMVGNSAQDLGELGSVSGSAGVAIGQMAEYFSDATLAGEGFSSALRSMITVLGPIAAITLVVGTITSYFQQQQDAAKAAAERTKQFGEAMQDASDDALGLADSLRENIDQITKFNADAQGFGAGIIEGLAEVGKAVPFVGGLIGDAGQQVQDLAPLFKAAGVSIYDFAKAIEDGGRVGSDFERQIREAVHTGKLTEDQYAAVADALREYGRSALDAQEKQALFNVSADEANAILQDLTTQADPLQKMGNAWATLMSDMADGTINTTAAADAINQLADGLGLTQQEVIKLAQGQLDKNMEAAAAATEKATAAAEEYARVVSSTDWGRSGIDAAVSSFTKLAEAQFGLTNIAAANQAAYDDLNQAIKDNGFTFDVATEKGRANVEQIQNLYSSLLPNLAAAYADAGGSVDQFAANMDTLRTQVFQQLDEQTSLSTDQINAVIDQLGAFDGSTYSSQFEMLGLEDANTKLALLSGVISSLPADVQKQVTLAIIAGDPQAALSAIETSVSTTPVPVPSTFDPSGAEKGVQGFADAEHPTATVPLDADDKEAQAGIKHVEDTAERTKPIIDVGASVTNALITMAIINAIAKAMAPTVEVSANIAPALYGLAVVAGQRPRVPVEAYLADYPTASEIQARIGRPRIPVDIVVGQSIRITGVRD